MIAAQQEADVARRGKKTQEKKARFVGLAAWRTNAAPANRLDVLLKVGQVAEILSVHSETVRRLIDSGVIAAVINETTGHRRVRLSDVEAFQARMALERSQK